MLNLFEVVQNAVAYRKTVAELNALSPATLLDLDIYADDIKRIARDAVYGQPKLRNVAVKRASLPMFLGNPAH